MREADALYLGLMSGTSVDGIDAAIVAFPSSAEPSAPRARLIYGKTYPWDETLRQRVVALGQQAATLSLDEVGELDTQLGQTFAQVAQQAIEESGTAESAIAAIGSHGQTLRHRPSGPHPYTLQLGDPNCIAERTGITTVADFRRRDVAAGGQGAPLLPAFHAAMLHSPDEDRAVLNLGGIANLTLLPRNGAVSGFDTGPANGLMDAWCARHTGARYDRDGAWASSGQLDPVLLARLLDEPWFAQAPPKSTGRDRFHLGWLEPRLRGEAPADVQATLLTLTARSVAAALLVSLPTAARLIVCGGGVHNPALLSALASALPQMAIVSSAAHGLDPDFVEAMGFAWLARETLAGRPGNLVSVTGARAPRVLGAIYAAH